MAAKAGAVGFYTPQLHELVDCREEFYSPTESVVFIGFSLEKVSQVFTRMVASAQQVGKEGSEEFNAHVVNVTHKTFVHEIDLGQTTTRLPGDATLLLRNKQGEKPSVYWQLCLVKTLATDNNPANAALKKMVLETYKPPVERTITRFFISFFKPEDLNPTQVPYNTSGKIESFLPDGVVDLVLNYALALPGPEELIQTTRKKIPFGPKRHTYSIHTSFNYPAVAEKLSQLASICVGLGREQLAKSLLSQVANTTYHLRERNVRRENVNADRFVEPGEAHWEMNLSLKVDEATATQCTNPDILKIYFLFLRYKVEPKKSGFVELSPEEPKPVEIENFVLPVGFPGVDHMLPSEESAEITADGESV